VYDWPTHRISRWCRGVCTRARAALFDSLVAAIRAVDADTPLAMAPLGYGACDDWGRAGPAGSSALLQDRNVIYAVNSPCHLGNSNPGYGTAMECQTLHRQPSGWSEVTIVNPSRRTVRDRGFARSPLLSSECATICC
jgi:hypothetical protein